MGVSVTGGETKYWLTIARWICEGEDQYSCWVRSGEINVQTRSEMRSEDMNENSYGTSPSFPSVPHPHTQNSSVPLPRNWNLPETLPSCSPASSPGFLQEV